MELFFDLAYGRSVQGAIVYLTALPYAQLSIAPEQSTDANGYAELSFHTLAGFRSTAGSKESDLQAPPQSG